MESLRADHLGCYGYERATTPNLDALASQATRYERAYSTTSWTLASHASIFTGLYGGAHRVLQPEDRLGDGYVTLAEALAASGYQTAGVASGPYLRAPHNLQQGFEYFDDSVSAIDDLAAHKDVTNPRMERSLDAFLRTGRDPERPFFLFAYFWDTHYDYIPPAPYDSLFLPAGAEPVEEVEFGPLTKLGENISPEQVEWLIGQYDGEIRCTDELLGRLWATLRELNLWDNTTIILTADHGEEFFEHGALGHKYNLHVESLHVPLLVKLPRQAAGATDSRLVSLVDLFPTALELAGTASDEPCQGVSLLAEPPDPRRPIYHSLMEQWTYVDRNTGESFQDSKVWFAVRQDRYKLLGVPGKFWKLYDVAEDPRERVELGPEHGADLRRMHAEIDRWGSATLEIATGYTGGGKADLDARERARLRSLGYIQ